MIKYLWDTQFARMADYSSQIKNVVKYLIQNRSIVVPPQVMEPVYQLKPYSKTIINELFDRCVNTGYINEFASILPIEPRGISRQTINVSVPEILTTTGLVVDFKNNPNGSPLASYFELNNKLLINLAGIVKRNEQTRNLIVSDINELHSMYVRSMLVRSFSVSDGWLTPSLSTFIVKTYALNAKAAGLQGVVCSPLEAPIIKELGLISVTPGIRFADDSKNDQKRVATPDYAKELGSTYIVVGRSITAAADPVAAYKRCVKEFC